MMDQIQPQPPVELVEFKEVTDTEVCKIIQELKPNSSTSDGISVKILKMLFRLKPDIVTKYINTSLIKGFVPKTVKESIVRPIFKKGDRQNPDNYRPISLTSNFVKIIEKPVKAQILDTLLRNSFFYQHQYSFLENRNTSDALFQLTLTVQNSLDKGEFASALFIDVKKAFDTVNHNILIEKVQAAGLNGNVKNWIASFLTNRTQVLSVNGVTSQSRAVVKGVPQGSILGPILFLIYINDIAKCDLLGNLVLFADDICLVYHHTELQNVIKMITKDITTLMQWFRDNQLVMNLDKTEYMLFSKKTCVDCDTGLVIDGKNIKRVSHVKYLGVIFDENLSWNLQINSIKKNLPCNICSL